MRGGEISVEVVYAGAEEQVVERLVLRGPVTVGGALGASKVARRWSEGELAGMAVGVFGVVRGREWVLQDGDRVEVYRGLVMTPREARRRRAGG